MAEPMTDRNAVRTQLLTFLIADVRGYTRFTRERGDAAAAMLATRFAELARDAVEARSGRVIELRGDEALAVFDSPAQAVRAALEFQATCAEESASDPNFPLPVGIGIDRGEAVPVEDGYRGVALNMAARLCSNAAAGQVLVTRTILDAAGAFDGEIRFVERGPASFKGFEQAIDVIEALADFTPMTTEVVAEDLGIPPELDPLTPLVDREHELRWLRGTWRQVRRGHGRLLFASGPAQIGKTRLAAEVASHVHREGGAVHYAGPGGASTAVALSALRDALGARAPTLLVLDDVDIAGPPVAEALGSALEEIAGRPLLVLGILRDRHAETRLADVVDRADELGDGHRALAALDLEGVRGIVHLYVGEDAAEVPVEAMARASGGIPGRVHEVVSDWARAEASRRLEAAAEFLAEGRERHAEGLGFANTVIGLKLGRLFTVEGRDVLTIDTCPYKGLASFEEEDSAFFFGRERLVGELAARTVQAGLLGVVGASGSGKSSVVAAGLLPSLRAGLLPGSGGWMQATMRPGEHPMAELARALDAPEGDDSLARALGAVESRLVLVVDQFEETFTLCASEDERVAFIDALTGAAARSPERIVAILAIRGDYYAHCAPYPALAEALAANHVLVGPLTREELRRAIELPARRAGLRIESALVDELVEEVADEPGGLPLLSTALVELWQTREGGWIRRETYERTGGVRGAVARLAESSFAELTDPEKDAARRIFLRLVAVGEGEAATKRRVELDELDLERDPAAAVVVTKLTQDRLLTMGEDTVEVAHEALLREWPRLQSWLDEDAQGRQLRQHLTQASKQWQAGGQEASELYRGARLSAALDWSTAHPAELNELERGFLTASRQASEQEADRQRRTNRRLRGLLAGVAVLLALALVAGSLALVQRGSARRSASAAERAAIVAEAQRLDAQSLVETSPDLSVLLARQALALDDSEQTRGALFTTLLRWTGVMRVIRPSANRLLRVAVSPNGSWFALSDNEHSLYVYDMHSFEQRLVIHGFVDDMVPAPDGRTLYAASAGTTSFGHPIGPETLEAFDPSTGQARWRTHVGNGGEGGFALSPDGRLIAMIDNPAIATPDGLQPSERPAHLTLLRASDGTEIGHPLRVPEPFGVGFAGRDRILIGSGRQVEVLDARTMRVVRTVPGLGKAYFVVSPDGSTVALARPTGDVRLVDLRTGASRTLRTPSQAENSSLVFSPDGDALAAGEGNGPVVLWDLTDGTARSLVGHTGNVTGIAFSPDGRTLFTAGLDGTVVVSDLVGDRSIQRSFRSPYPPTNSRLPYLAFTPDGRTIGMTESGRPAVFLDEETLRQTGSLPKGSSVCCMPPAIDAAGDRMATVDGTGVDLWNVADRTLIRHLYTSHADPKTLPVDAVGISPDGRTVVANDGSTVLLIDARTGRVERRLDAGAYVGVLAMSRRGDLLAAGTGDGTTVMWDARTGDELWHANFGQTSLASFSSDDRLYAAGGNDGRVHVFQARSGQPAGTPFVGDAGYVLSVAFDPAAPLIATTGTNGVVTLSNPRTGKSFGNPLPGTNEAWSTGAWSPDGSEYVVVDNHGGGHVWQTSPRDWTERACTIAGRGLTRTEWEQYLPNRPYDPVC